MQLNRLLARLFRKAKGSSDVVDCSIPPIVVPCPKCRFGYVGPHTEEQCADAVESMRNPCPKCNHPNHDDSVACFQPIAGTRTTMPSFCNCGRDAWLAKIEAEHEAKNEQAK